MKIWVNSLLLDPDPDPDPHSQYDIDSDSDTGQPNECGSGSTTLVLIPSLYLIYALSSLGETRLTKQNFRFSENCTVMSRHKNSVVLERS